MPPRIRIRPSQWRRAPILHIEPTLHIRTYASAALATATSGSSSYGLISGISIGRHNPTQPPSHRRPDVRKTQLLRQYVALLKSSPVVLLFQHNSLLATELTAIRTLLKASMRKVDEAQKTEYADHIKLQVMRTGLLDTAIRIAEFWHPEPQDSPQEAMIDGEMKFTHGLSEEAFQALTENPQTHGLEPLLSGPIAALTIPWMSPDHLKVALSILAPSTEFPAPKRRAMPAYYEPSVQGGIPKLMLLGARIEGRAMDTVKTRWVGGVAGGIDGLRAQLVATLQGVSGGLVNTLDSAGKSLYLTLESRRNVLEKESEPETKSE
jgi:large subunit ribosomal protein L10